MKRLALLLPLLALAAGCALRPDVAGSRWKSVSLKWTDCGGDAGKPEAAHWARLSDEESVERLRRAFPERPLQPHEASGRRRDHEILVETETGASFRVFFWDPHQSTTSRSRLTVLDSPRETPFSSQDVSKIADSISATNHPGLMCMLVSFPSDSFRLMCRMPCSPRDGRGQMPE